MIVNMETKKRFLLYLILTVFFGSISQAQSPGSSFKEAIPVEFSSENTVFTDTKDTRDYDYYNYQYRLEENGKFTYTDGSVVFYRLQITEEESITIHNWGSPTLGFSTIFLVEPKDPTVIPDYEYNCDFVTDVALSKMGDRYDLEKLNAPTDACEGQGYIHLERLPAGTYYIITGGYKGSNGSMNNGLLRTTVILGSNSTDPEKPDPEEPDPDNPDPEVPDDTVDDALSEDYNYIQIITPNIAGESIDSFSSLKSATRNILYYDELGRPVQKLAYKASPNRKDIVSLQEYDWQGREDKQWLPAVRNDGKAATFIESKKIISAIKAFYQDDAAFSHTVYENSPLNRVNESFGPGTAWQSTGHSNKSNYQTNLQEDGCLHFIIKGTPALPELELAGLYPIQELDITKTIDEDGHTKYTFTDKTGNAILKRQVAKGDTLDTYQVYDDLGNLCFVLPPSAIDAIKTNIHTNGVSIQNTLLDQHAYQYRYDYRNRCINKKLPKCDWIEMIYDHTDRLIFIQDGEQRKYNEWNFSIMDILNRITLSGIYHGTPDKEKCDASYIYTDFTGKPTDNYGYQINYYMNAIIPDSMEILQVNYYDTYDNQSITASTLDYAEDASYGKRYIDQQSGQHFKDLLTGSITQVLGSSDKLYARYYYDYDRNLIQSRKTSLNEKVIVNKALFNFNGQPTATSEEYDNDARLLKSYVYDHTGRLTEETHCIGIDTTRIVYAYDETGRTKSQTRIHKTDSITITNSYNIRGWLTSIECPVFKQILHYTDGTGIPCYNGNISSMTWQSHLPHSQENMTETKGYRFTYDGLSRLKDAEYGEGENLQSNLNRFNEQITEYDKMGNILGLKRFGQISSDSYGLVDDLSLNYNGNQLQAVTDNAASSAFDNGFEFKDGAQSPVEYIYDTNGNLTKDLNKKIADIQYNVLNLPNKIQFEDGNSIIYLYDANGNKLQTTHIIDGTTVTTDYCNNAIYENGVPVKLLTEYGYITLTDNTYHYFILDHQGNNRVVVNQNGEIEEVNHYYPFGGVFTSTSSVQPYKYNGKELDRKGGLDWYDYGARMYDAALGRWHTVDPLSEIYDSFTPYLYCGADPINYIDPFGMDYWSTNNPNEIARFMDTLRFGNNSIFESFNFDSWNHATDSEFTGNLTFNDKTNTFYSSYGTVEDGVLTSVGISIKASKVWDGGASIDGWKGRWYKKASGRMENIYPEFHLISFGRGLINLASEVVKSTSKELFNFSTKAAEHMAQKERAVPIQILQQAIKGTKGVIDPRGSKALMHTTKIWKNGKLYNLEVLYDKATNSIWHFKYYQ